jgi:hypothetical protein
MQQPTMPMTASHGDTKANVFAGITTPPTGAPVTVKEPNAQSGSVKLLRDRLACRLSRHGDSAVQPKMRRLYHGFPLNRVKVHESV